ncbi:hypothetical protein P5673_032474 [Acropora cervicornis]|uniref:Uncharacterized protein n=1 Tax=Acropora cervicornis TaxID=6130 RepID=A0AAD9PRE4_ACRCE|nr:hypothetical protein P5673_032474 [Acropora cervicornis]
MMFMNKLKQARQSVAMDMRNSHSR